MRIEMRPRLGSFIAIDISYCTFSTNTFEIILNLYLQSHYRPVDCGRNRSKTRLCSMNFTGVWFTAMTLTRTIQFIQPSIRADWRKYTQLMLNVDPSGARCISDRFCFFFFNFLFLGNNLIRVHRIINHSNRFMLYTPMPRCLCLLHAWNFSIVFTCYRPGSCFVRAYQIDFPFFSFILEVEMRARLCGPHWFL